MAFGRKDVIVREGSFVHVSPSVSILCVSDSYYYNVTCNGRVYGRDPSLNPHFDVMMPKVRR